MNIEDSFIGVVNYFSPKIIGEVNDQYIKIAKIKGQKIPWHNHENEDELFFIIKGVLKMEVESRDTFIMKKGDLYVVKKGTNHRVSSKDECLVMLIESKTTEHTGKVKSEITKTIEEQNY
jgi:quercetin dioxygenase-like cupin family protein